MAVTDAGAHRPQRCVAAGSTGRCFSERTRLVLVALWRARCNVERNVLATDALSTAGEMVPVELMLTATSLQQVRDTRPQLRLRSADRPRPIGAPIGACGRLAVPQELQNQTTLVQQLQGADVRNCPSVEFVGSFAFPFSHSTDALLCVHPSA